MLAKTVARLRAADPGPRLAQAGPLLARGFGESGERSVSRYIRREFPELLADFEELDTRERKLAYETFVTWQSTLMYRLNCVLHILDFNPLIVGDPGWNDLLAGREGWRYHPELSYYDDLPDFYPASAVNFNCTSRQMKGAVNQRVFDVPCCGAFLITDHRAQVENLFEPEREIVFYRTEDEIPALVDMYLNAPDRRESVTRAARKRILAEHTYDHRMVTLMEAMRETFA